MERRMDKFWMVWGEGQRAPAVTHPNQLDAEKEAERLSSKDAGVIFVVLESLGHFQRGAVFYTKHEDEK